MRAYQGTRKIAKTHVPRLKFPAPATVETWVSDAAGDPLLVVMAEPAASLAAELRRLIPELRATVGDDRRVLVGFDRGGWSATLFADLHAAGFDTLTWRKGATADVDEDAFTEHSHTDEHGRTHTWRLADTQITLDIADGPRAGEVFPMRQISLFNAAATRQMHILTTRADLPAAEIRYRMGSRWRQENHYRYARIHFDLDSHDTYRATDDDPTRMVLSVPLYDDHGGSLRHFGCRRRFGLRAFVGTTNVATYGGAAGDGPAPYRTTRGIVTSGSRRQNE